MISGKRVGEGSTVIGEERSGSGNEIGSEVRIDCKRRNGRGNGVNTLNSSIKDTRRAEEGIRRSREVNAEIVPTVENKTHGHTVHQHKCDVNQEGKWKSA